MDKSLKNALIIIGVLLVIYYWISPYRDCVRDELEDGLEYCAESWVKYPNLYKSKKDCNKQWKQSVRRSCGNIHSW